MTGEIYRNMQGAGAAIGSLELCERPFRTDGDNTYDIVPLGPVLEGLGPKITELVVHVDCSEKTANLKYKVRNAYSYDGQNWQTGVDLISEQTTTGYVIGSSCTDRQKFGRYMRFEVCVNDTGAVEQAFLKVALYWKYDT